jgi:hypothetical protein
MTSAPAAAQALGGGSSHIPGSSAAPSVNEKAVRLAQKMQVGPRTPMGTQL